jgi:hypothetical protein
MKIAVVATALLTCCSAMPSALGAQVAITRAHIGYFLEVAFNNGNGRLVGWAQPARIRIASTSLIKSDPDLDRIIAELNRIAGRRLLVRNESEADIEVRYVSPGHFTDVDASLRSSWSRTDIEEADSGRIESGVVLLSAQLSGEPKLGALRRNLAQVVGLLYGSRRHSRSLFYEGNTTHSALVFEPFDRAIIRILGENEELRGMSVSEVRQRLEARYLK